MGNVVALCRGIVPVEAEEEMISDISSITMVSSEYPEEMAAPAAPGFVTPPARTTGHMFDAPTGKPTPERFKRHH